MKVTCGREALNQAFQVASSVVPVRSTIPILQNVKVTARGKGVKGTLEVVGNDLEIGVRCAVESAAAAVPVDVAEDGILVLPAGRVSGLLRESQDDTVTLESEGSLATLRFKDSRYKIVGTDPADFPDLPAFDARNAVKVETPDISAMIRRTLFATSEESTRYALTGVLLDLREQELRLVASDGKRMAYTRAKTAGSGKPVKVIVPPKALQLLDRVLGQADAVVQVQVEENQIKMQTSRAMIFSRLIEGSFPEYEDVIPKGADKKVKVPVGPFHSAMRRATLMTSDKGKAVKLAFAKNRLRLETRAAEIGESEIEMAIDYGGEPVDIVFNPDFFLDFLRVVEDATLEFELKDRNTAVVLRAAGGDYTYLVMPLKIDL
jgi:DNA polymerase III subunit beta